MEGLGTRSTLPIVDHVKRMTTVSTVTHAQRRRVAEGAVKYSLTYSSVIIDHSGFGH